MNTNDTLERVIFRGRIVAAVWNAYHPQYPYAEARADMPADHHQFDEARIAAEVILAVSADVWDEGFIDNSTETIDRLGLVHESRETALTNLRAASRARNPYRSPA